MVRRWGRAFAVRSLKLRVASIAVAAVAATTLAASQKADSSTCTFLPEEITWIQRALDGWEQVSREFLRLDATPLPWIVLFDSGCIWHLSPTPVSARTSGQFIRR
jgi:hypothetical protein